MARITSLHAFLTDIADAIRTKKGDSGTISATDFDAEILGLQGTYQQKAININQNGSQTILPDTNYDAIDELTINTSIDPDITTATSNDLLSPKTAYSNHIKITGNILPTYDLDSLSLSTKDISSFGYTNVRDIDFENNIGFDISKNSRRTLTVFNISTGEVLAADTPSDDNRANISDVKIANVGEDIIILFVPRMIDFYNHCVSKYTFNTSTNVLTKINDYTGTSSTDLWWAYNEQVFPIIGRTDAYIYTYSKDYNVNSTVRLIVANGNSYNTYDIGSLAHSSSGSVIRIL